ncbi:MAG: ATP-grasp domain-containing protein, partial [Pseudomonadota bacterium]|nr:ATP-grasp domain-containing protein [Pseudomonadota bacterium]
CSRIQIISGKDLKHFDSKKYIIQEYIKGKSFSASIFCSKGNFTILSLNEHQVKKNKNNYIKINKIIVNKNISDNLKIYGLINKLKKNISTLSGYIGIDFIITNDDIYIIELNPRITTSFTKLNSTLGINLARLINNSNIITPICGKTSRINLL